MKINRIKIKNFMRIKDADISLSDKGVIGVLGKLVGNEGRSNYIGKTTLLEAIRYAITGNSRVDEGKDTNLDDLISYDEDQMVVALILEDGNEKLFIKRGRDRKGNGILETNHSTSKQNSQEVINKFINMEPEDFDLTVYFKQAEISKFMSMTPSEKKKIIMKWQNIDHWTVMEKAVNEDLKEAKNKLRDNQIALSTVKRNLDRIEDILPEMDSCRYELSKATKLVEDIQKSISNVPKTVTEDELDELNFEHSKLQREVNNFSTMDKSSLLADKEKLFTSFDKIKKTIDKPIPEYVQSIKDKIKQYDDQLKNLHTEYTKLADKIKIGSGGNGICPIIHEQCDRITYTDKQIEQFKNTLNDIKGTINETSELKSDCESKLENVSKLQNLKAKLDTIESKIDICEKNEIVYNEKKDRLKKIADKLSKVDTSNVRMIQKLKDDLEDANLSKSKYTQKMAVLEHKLKMIEKQDTEIKEMEEAVLKSSLVVEDLGFVSYMFSKNGIASLEIENSFVGIEDQVNYVLSLFDENISIKVEADRETKTWESHCLSCGKAFDKGTKKIECQHCGTKRQKKRTDELRIDINEGGKRLPFAMASGGLKTIVSIAVRTALSLMVRDRNSTNFSIIFLDEIDSALDAYFKEKIMIFVKDVLHKKLNFEQIFWISHDKGISENLDDVILVQGYKDHSKLVWV